MQAQRPEGGLLSNAVGSLHSMLQEQCACTRLLNRPPVMQLLLRRQRFDELPMNSMSLRGTRSPLTLIALAANSLHTTTQTTMIASFVPLLRISSILTYLWVARTSFMWRPKGARRGLHLPLHG
jgi:hypothetical protein